MPPKLTAPSREFAPPGRIVSAQTWIIETPFLIPYKLTKRYGVRATTRAILLRLEDTDGMVGWGEANPLAPFTEESIEDEHETLSRALLPALFRYVAPAPALIDRDFDRMLPDHLCAKGAVSMALLDIAGKRAGIACAEMLGGAVQDVVPVLWPLNNQTADDDARVIDERAAQGFRTYMLKMGMASIAEELDRLASLERRYGGAITFIADANQGWSAADTANFLAGVKPNQIAFLEQPIDKHDMAAMADLQRSTDMPLSADESLTSLGEAAEAARLGSARVFSIKSSKNGGPLRARKITSVAEAFGIRCYMNSMLEFGVTQAASLQHAATLTNLFPAGHAYMSTLRLHGDPTDFSSFVKNGHVHVPRRPGLGIEVDLDRVARLATAHANHSPEN